MVSVVESRVGSLLVSFTCEYVINSTYPFPRPFCLLATPHPWEQAAQVVDKL
jgi:hypothetical protein